MMAIHGGHHGFGGAAADGDFTLGVIGDVLVRQIFHDGVANGLAPQVMAYWLMSSEMALAGGFFDFFGRRIGKNPGEIDGVVLHGQAGHFADDEFGELLGLGESIRRTIWVMLVFSRCAIGRLVAKVRKLFRGGFVLVREN